MKKPFSRFEVFARIESLIEVDKLRRITLSSAGGVQAAATASS